MRKISVCTGTGIENPFDLNVPVDDTPHIPASAHFRTSTFNLFSSPFAASNPFTELPIPFQLTILINQDNVPSTPSSRHPGDPPPVPPRLRRHARLPVKTT